MQWLAQRYDLTRVPMGGASGGALAAALARCGVDAEEITESAYRLSLQHRIWDRPLGLVGVWGSIIEAWLHELLPADAAARCSGGMGVVVTQLPSCRQLWIDSFRDKADVVNCCMASAHVPLLLDWRVARPCRGAACVDGSFPDFFKGGNCAHIEVGRRAARVGGSARVGQPGERVAGRTAEPAAGSARLPTSAQRGLLVLARSARPPGGGRQRPSPAGRLRVGPMHSPDPARAPPTLRPITAGR
jgi:hypothetical protein